MSFHRSDEVYEDVCTASLDARGWVGEDGDSVAPELPGTVAAACVRVARYTGAEVFCDPFCGHAEIGTRVGASGMPPLLRSPRRGSIFLLKNAECEVVHCEPVFEVVRA